MISSEFTRIKARWCAAPDWERKAVLAVGSLFAWLDRPLEQIPVGELRSAIQCALQVLDNTEPAIPHRFKSEVAHD